MRKMKKSRKLFFQVIIDSRFIDDYKTNGRPEASRLTDYLGNLFREMPTVSYEAEKAREINFFTGKQWRVDFLIQKEGNKPTWDDLCGQISDVLRKAGYGAPCYKFLF